jgi:hypothetical protein
MLTLKLVKIGTLGVHMKRALSCLVLYNRFCPALALVTPEKNIVFLSAKFFTLLVSFAQQRVRSMQSRARIFKL